VHVAVVLLLLPEALAEGRVVGHAEIVDTGERKPIRSAQELVEMLCALTPDAGSPGQSRAVNEHSAVFGVEAGHYQRRDTVTMSTMLLARRWTAAAGVALIASLVSGQAAQAAARTSAGNTIGGTVYDLQSGTPLSGICDQIMDVNNNYNVLGVQVSQPDGTWQQPNLPDGTYTVEFFDCRGSDYPFYFLGDTPLLDHASSVTLSGGVSNTSLQIHMPPGGGVSGTVTDAATHQPVNDMQVEIFYPQLISGEQAYAGFTCTDQLGTWRIGGAPVTGAKVRYDGFGCRGETYSYQQAYYHQKATFNAAVTVPVSANQDSTGLNQLVMPPKSHSSPNARSPQPRTM
jgi:hypothetical protein